VAGTLLETAITKAIPSEEAMREEQFMGGRAFLISGAALRAYVRNSAGLQLEDCE
jgi:hypothetical protein